MSKDVTTISEWRKGKVGDPIVISPLVALYFYPRAKYTNFGDIQDFQEKHELTSEQGNQLALELHRFVKFAQENLT